MVANHKFVSVDTMGKRDDSSTVRQGTVVSIRGSVIDVRFPESLPEVYSLLKAGEDKRTTSERRGHGEIRV